MANEEHLEILQRSVKEWNAWREEHPEIVPDLSGANLRDADLRDADLHYADLHGANLIFANLSGADLSDANLSNSTMGSTLLSHLDLSEAEGLDEVLHSRPSSIGTDTLYKFASKIPEVFLRGCGVPENLIQYLPSLLVPSAIQFYSCFISYSHADKPLARHLHDQLQARGIRCWLDEKEMRLGEDIPESVADAIREHDRVLLCCSVASLQSDWVENEIEWTLEKEQEKGRKILIPLNLDGYLFKGWRGQQCAKIRRRLAADFTGWEHDNAKFEEEFERVVKALRTDKGSRAKAPEGNRG